jgi:cell division transport system ATP-binding protein
VAGSETAPREETQRAVLTLQVDADGRLRLLPRPPPPAPPAEETPEPLAETIVEVAPVPAPPEAPARRPRLFPRLFRPRPPAAIESTPEPVPEIAVEVAPALPPPERREKRPRPAPLVVAEPEPEEQPIALPGVAVPQVDSPAPAKGHGALIDFRNVTLRFGKEAAVAEMSLTVEPGEFVALLGPSGAGKTSVLRLLQGLTRPTSGRLWIDRVAVHRTWPFQIRRLRRRIGVVFQDYSLLANRTALENVVFALQVSDLTVPRSEAKRRAREQLALVGLSGREKSRPEQLSGGQQQRLAVARALVTRPRILLADEPTASLDKAQARNVMRLFEQIADSGTTVILATHDHALVNNSRARIITMSKGRVVGERRGRKQLRVVR